MTTQIETADGVEIETGDWVVMGERDDIGYGEVEGFDERGEAVVRWYDADPSYYGTTVRPGSVCDVYTDRNAAREAYEARCREYASRAATR